MFAQSWDLFISQLKTFQNIAQPIILAALFQFLVMKSYEAKTQCVIISSLEQLKANFQQVGRRMGFDAP